MDVKGKRILLQACCGPCTLGALPPLLDEGAEVALFDYNPCIIDGEFEKRYVALKTVAEHYGVQLIVPPHDHASYVSYAQPHAPEKEGGVRCSLCMSDRLKAAAVYARDNGFDMFTTTLTVSPHKNAELIFSLGGDIGAEVGIEFLARDFKKKNGFLNSCTLSRELGIYRQRFCGCEYSATLAGIDIYEYSGMIKAQYADIAEQLSKEW